MLRFRSYSTAKRVVTDQLWPTGATSPSPYQIFHLQEGQQHYEKKQLKKIYHSYVKLYHPDISKNNLIVSQAHANRVLTPQEKLQRFKTISVAYKQLLSHNVPYNPPSHTYAYTHAYAHPRNSTWEQEEHSAVDVNPWHVYYLVLGTCIVFTGSIYLTDLQNSIHLSNQYTTNSQRIDEQDIQMAHWQELYDKYVGAVSGDSKIERIKRFLWIRLWHDEDLTNANDINQSLQKNNELIDFLIQSKKK